jgi:hypothetical protein
MEVYSVAAYICDAEYKLLEHACNMPGRAKAAQGKASAHRGQD